MTLSRGLAVALGLVCAGNAAAQSSDPLGFTLVQAVRLTLEKQPEIRIQEQQVEVNRGVWETARAAFDPRLQTSLQRYRDHNPLLEAQQAPGIEDVRTDGWGYSARATQRFRSGLVVGPTLDFTRTTVNLAPIPESRTKVAFLIQRPFLRGHGAAATAASENAARIDLDAANLDLRYQVSISIVRTVSAYWSYVAAYRNLTIVRDSESRFRTLLDEVGAMIQADQIAASEAKQLRANLAARVAQRVAAEQSLFEARQALGLAAGLSAEEIFALPAPADPLPEADFLGEVGAGPGAFLDMAIAQRADLMSARTRTQSAEALLGAARSAGKPQFDLQLQAGWAGLGEGASVSRFFSPIGTNVAGLNAQASLVLDLPFGNRAGRGQLASQLASVSQARLSTSDLERRIRSAVAIAVSNLAASSQRVATSRESSELFRAAVDDEKEKLRLGIGTTIDVIQTEDRLTQALASELEAQLNYANALARVRFETGSLLDMDTGRQEITMQALTTVPAARK
jgi:outer membrane protein TolC